MRLFAKSAACFLALLPAPTFAQAEIDPGVGLTEDAIPTPYFLDLSLVRLIECTVPEGRYLGTGWYISATDLATAYHVIAQGDCTVGGAPIEVVYADKARDFAVVRTPLRSARRFAISCAGFREGEDYFAVGYALGSDFAVQRVSGTTAKVASSVDAAAMAGDAVLRGKGFHGQSGGPIADRDGRIVGIVSAGPEDGTPHLLSRPLTDTYLCSVGAQRTAS